MLRAIRYALSLMMAVLACASCQEYAVGPTTVAVTEHGEAWPDLPEALHAMQQATGWELSSEAWQDVWDAHVILGPAWSRVGRPGQACVLYLEIDEIHARVVREFEPATRDGCLPHEFAHRWRKAVGGDPRAHDAAFREAEVFLRAAAAETWYVDRRARRQRR